jgi:hypothetical protein
VNDSTVRTDSDVPTAVTELGSLPRLFDLEGSGVETSWASEDSVGSSASGVCVGRGAGVFVGAAASVGAVVGSGSLGVSVGWVVLAVPVLVWALTTTPPVTVFVVVPDDVVPLSCSDVTGVVEVCVSVVVVPVVVVVLVLVAPPVVDVSDAGGFEVVSSAEATPYPVAIAVPTPNATASPPTRPI